MRCQLFHREAADWVEARHFKTGRAAMVMRSFSQDHRWHDDFAGFAAPFGLGIPPRSKATPELPCGGALSLGWLTRARRNSSDIRNHILAPSRH